MRISRLRITNHQRVTDLDIEVRRHLVLVGVNDIGKTTILRCVDSVLRASMSQLHAWFGADQFRDPARPLVVETSLVDLKGQDLGRFADDIEVVGGGGETVHRLTVRLTISLDPEDPESKSVARRFVKPGVEQPVPYRDLEAFGWTYLPAGRSADHELGTGRTGAVQALLGEVDLGDDEEVLSTALTNYQTGLNEAKSLAELRNDVATALAAVYPRSVSDDDVSVKVRDLSDVLLGHVDIHVGTPRGQVRLAEQSDGIRALTTIALNRLARRSARIVAIDEPELHLHPRSQARVGAVLAAGPGQAIVATHSPQVLASFLPSDVVAFAPDGTSRQVDPTGFDRNLKFLQHHWLDSALEPLTARVVVAVEGPSDRIMLHAAARAHGLDLDQSGICVVVVRGASNFSSAYRLFGPAGFDVALLTLVDEQEASIVAKDLGCTEADLDSRGVLICRADLEDECVRGIGAVRCVELLARSGLYQERQILGACRAATADTIPADVLAGWCRKDKVRTAMALAQEIRASDVVQIAVLADLVTRLAAL
ncbi:ATP-dependent nuclease [Parafrankia elaeagni]|uniref:ATP-dependent nuclease n=1 Tax=Parafrankia elaeagni TaxID=222534 RepID=UPI0003A3F20A|nr:AAA family ATPase [Parafrankia elaeagni]